MVGDVCQKPDPTREPDTPRKKPVTVPVVPETEAETVAPVTQAPAPVTEAKTVAPVTQIELETEAPESKPQSIMEKLLNMSKEKYAGLKGWMWLAIGFGLLLIAIIGLVVCIKKKKSSTNNGFHPGRYHQGDSAKTIPPVSTRRRPPQPTYFDTPEQQQFNAARSKSVKKPNVPMRFSSAKASKPTDYNNDPYPSRYDTMQSSKFDHDFDD